MERATQERLVGATLLIVAGVILIPWLLDGSMTGSGVTEQELVLPGGNDSGNETRRITLDVPHQDSQGVAGSAREIDARSVREAGQEAPPMNLPTPEAREASTSAVPARFAKPMPEKAATPAAKVAETANVPDTPEKAETVQPKPKQAVASTTSSSLSSSASGVQSGSGAGGASLPPQPAPTKTSEAPASKAAKVPASPTEKAWAVQVGSFASQENAERLAERLRGKSYKAFVMRNVIDGRVRFRVRVGPVIQRSEAELLATALREDRQPARILSHP